MARYIYKTDTEILDRLQINVNKVMEYKENITITIKDEFIELYPMCKKPYWDIVRKKPVMVYYYQTVNAINSVYPLVDIEIGFKVKKGEYVCTNQIERIVLN